MCSMLAAAPTAAPCARPAAGPRSATRPAHARRTPGRASAVPPRRDAQSPSGAGCSQIYSRLSIHRQRLEHLVQTGATTALELSPVVSELRQLTDTACEPGAWEELRQQIDALERAIMAAAVQAAASSERAAAAAAAAAAAPTAATTSSSCSSSSGSTLQGARASFATAGGARLELCVPDPDAGPALAPAAAPRLAVAGRVTVCTARKCCQQGAMATLAAARAAAVGSGVEVVASKCMGKCGKGPCVRTRVEGRDGSLLTKGVPPEATATLLRQQFGAVC